MLNDEEGETEEEGDGFTSLLPSTRPTDAKQGEGIPSSSRR